MKRMYVTLGVMFLLVFWAISCLGQKNTQVDSDTDRIQKFYKMREEMHRRMMDSLMGGASDMDMFEDMEKFFDVPAMTQNYSSEWLESQSGRTLAITPKTPDQKLDIDVKNNLITIKGKLESKSQNGTSTSSFTNSFNVPGDCDAKRVKITQEKEKILIQFPYQDVKTVTVPDRKPLPHNDSDIAI